MLTLNLMKCCHLKLKDLMLKWHDEKDSVWLTLLILFGNLHLCPQILQLKASIKGPATSSIIYCPGLFFPTHILKLLTLSQTFKLGSICDLDKASRNKCPVSSPKSFETGRAKKLPNFFEKKKNFSAQNIKMKN